MSDYLVIGDWTGQRQIPVEIIGETPGGFQIKALERVFLPGRGFLKKGQSALVAKSLVKMQDRDRPEVLPQDRRHRPIAV